MSRTAGALCMVVDCKMTHTTTVRLDGQDVAVVCDAHADQLGDVATVSGTWNDDPTVVQRRVGFVRVDPDKAHGWRLVTSIEHSKDRVVLYPPPIGS